MNIEKIAQPMHEARNHYIKWLESKEASNVVIYETTHDYSEDEDWYYYDHITAFIGDLWYSCIFMLNKVDYKESIEFKSDEDDERKFITIKEFYELFKIN